MATKRFQHTVQLPEAMETAWQAYRAHQAQPESFNAFIHRLIQQELEALCVTAAPSSTIPSGT